MNKTFIKFVARLLITGLLLGLGGICLLAAVYNAQANESNRRSFPLHLSAYQCSIEEHLAPMLPLVDLLHEYAATHGRYPSNDEGLAPLAKLFDTQITITHVGPWMLNEWSNPYDTFGEARELLTIITRYADARELSLDEPLTICAEEIGYFPYAEDGGELRLVWRGSNDDPERFFIIDHAGVYSVWKYPFMYENRRGLPAEAFANSPVNDDPEGKFSIEVDDGIYLYSVNAWGAARHVPELGVIRPVWSMAITGGILVTAGLVTLVLPWRGHGSTWGGLCLLGASFLGMFIVIPTARTGCYEVMMPIPPRDPEMIAYQKQLLDQYHARGVINDEAYARLVRAAEASPGQPVSADESSDADE